MSHSKAKIVPASPARLFPCLSCVISRCQQAIQVNWLFYNPWELLWLCRHSDALLSMLFTFCCHRNTAISAQVQASGSSPHCHGNPWKRQRARWKRIGWMEEGKDGALSSLCTKQPDLEAFNYFIYLTLWTPAYFRSWTLLITVNIKTYFQDSLGFHIMRLQWCKIYSSQRGPLVLFFSGTERTFCSLWLLLIGH